MRAAAPARMRSSARSRARAAAIASAARQFASRWARVASERSPPRGLRSAGILASSYGNAASERLRPELGAGPCIRAVAVRSGPGLAVESPAARRQTRSARRIRSRQRRLTRTSAASSSRSAASFQASSASAMPSAVAEGGGVPARPACRWRGVPERIVASPAAAPAASNSASRPWRRVSRCRRDCRCRPWKRSAAAAHCRSRVSYQL